MAVGAQQNHRVGVRPVGGAPDRRRALKIGDAAGGSRAVSTTRRHGSVGLAFAVPTEYVSIPLAADQDDEHRRPERRHNNETEEHGRARPLVPSRQLLLCRCGDKVLFLLCRDSCRCTDRAVFASHRVSDRFRG